MKARHQKRRRMLVASLAALSLLTAGAAASTSAQAATTVTVQKTGLTGSSNSFPFGRADLWPPHLVWVYKNIPAFDLKPGDTIAFDLQAPNDVPIQVQIAMAPTTTNGGDQPAATFTQIVNNNALPADPDGNATTGDYELAFTAVAPFHFAGGGLVIRVSNPAGAFATDMTDTTVFLNNLGPATDPSNFFVKRIAGDPDGVSPWTGNDLADYVAGFRLSIADVPPSPPATPAKKKKCKKRKKHSAAAAKKCKKHKK